MSHDLRSQSRIVPLTPARPVQTSLVAQVWMAFLLIAVGGTVLGGLLGFFSLHAEDAVIAQAAGKSDPVAMA